MRCHRNNWVLFFKQSANFGDHQFQFKFKKIQQNNNNYMSNGKLLPATKTFYLDLNAIELLLQNQSQSLIFIH